MIIKVISLIGCFFLLNGLVGSLLAMCVIQFSFDNLKKFREAQHKIARDNLTFSFDRLEMLNRKKGSCK